MTRDELIAANSLVAGMGQSGLAALRLLRQHGGRPAATDVKPLEEMPGVAKALEDLGVPFAVQSPGVFAGRDLIVLSPGVPADLDVLREARQRGAKVIGEVELASFFLEGKILGITGSNGKTTTTALTGHILREAGIPVQVGGNIGWPPTSMTASSRADQWNVLELSSFQLESIDQCRVHIAAVLNVTPDHLDRHGSMDAYAAAKQRIFERQQPGDVAVLNADDAICARFAGQLRSAPVWFSSSRPVERGLTLEGERVLYDGELLIETRDIPLRGRHNVENAMAAAAAAHSAGAPLGAIAAAIRTFPGVEHRLEYVRTVGGVDYFNDSKATNVDATRKAIDAFNGRLWIILGGKDKDSDYTVLREPLAAKAHGALLIGAAAAKISAQLGEAVRQIPCGDLDSAVAEAHRRASAGDTVVLAPACASFDQFENYEHRGRVFKAAVARLEEHRASKN